MKKNLKATHQIIYQQPDDNLLGYFGWASVARLQNGTLVAGASGFRNSHVCPWGQVVLFQSNDNGKSWSDPQIIHNSPIDDRDVGLVGLPDGRLMVSWFTSDTRFYYPEGSDMVPNRINLKLVLESWNDAMVHSVLGSFLKIRNHDGSWTSPIPVNVTAPHGPITTRSGRLIYMGNVYETSSLLTPHRTMEKLCSSGIMAIASDDNGQSWINLGTVPSLEVAGVRFVEPHVVELADSSLLALLRCYGGKNNMTAWQTVSSDGGQSWSKPVLVTYGSPPHLLLHSSGVLIATCGYRQPDFGQRVMFSFNNGRNWDTDWIIRNDGPDSDLGYPATVELEDGSLYSVYYQAPAGQKNCAVQGSHWQLPF